MQGVIRARGPKAMQEAELARFVTAHQDGKLLKAEECVVLACLCVCCKKADERLTLTHAAPATCSPRSPSTARSRCRASFSAGTGRSSRRSGSLRPHSKACRILHDDDVVDCLTTTRLESYTPTLDVSRDTWSRPHLLPRVPLDAYNTVAMLLGNWRAQSRSIRDPRSA